LIPSLATESEREVHTIMVRSPKGIPGGRASSLSKTFELVEGLDSYHFKTGCTHYALTECKVNVYGSLPIDMSLTMEMEKLKSFYSPKSQFAG